MMMASRRAKTPHSSAHSASALYDLFRDPSVRLLLVSCLVLQISQQVKCVSVFFTYVCVYVCVCVCMRCAKSTRLFYFPHARTHTHRDTLT